MLSRKMFPTRTATTTASLCLLLLGCSGGEDEGVGRTNPSTTDVLDADDAGATDATGDDARDMDASVSSPNGNAADAPNGSTPTDATGPSEPGASARDDGTDAPAEAPEELSCAAGSYDHDDDPSTACQEHTTCAAGEFVQSEGTASSDRVCAACSSGTYSDETNAAACSPWTACAWSEAEAQAPSATLDRGCEPGSEYRFLEGSAKSIAIDSQDNVLVGTNPGSVTKLDPNGVELWVDDSIRTYEDVSVAVDSHDAVLVAMNSFDDYQILLSKYEADGTRLWREPGNETPERPPRPAFVTVDVEGNAIVAGTDAYRPFVAKFNPEGDQLWFDDFASGPLAFANSVATDGAGNVLVAGNAEGTLPGIEGEFPGALFVIKYDADGNQLWLQQFQVGGTFEEAHAVAVDSERNVLVAGFSKEGSSDSADAFVRKCDLDGNEIWTRRFGTESADWAFALAVDADDNVLVGGRTAGALDGDNAGDDDAFVRQYDADGNELWTQQFGGEDSDEVSALAVDSQGRVFAAGYLRGRPESPGFLRLLPKP